MDDLYVGYDSFVREIRFHNIVETEMKLGAKRFDSTRQTVKFNSGSDNNSALQNVNYLTRDPHTICSSN